MTTELMIKKLREIADKHKEDGLYTCDVNLSETCEEAAAQLEKLSACVINQERKINDLTNTLYELGAIE